MSLPHFRPRQVLVTGGAGFIGANFIRKWLQRDTAIKIYNLDSLTYAGSLRNLAGLSTDRHIFIQGDITDHQLIANTLRQYAIDTIVHFAAESHVDRSISGPAPFIHTNIVGTFTLLEAARQYWLQEKQWDASYCRFHHISTDEVFGTLEASDPPFHENTRYAPNSPYSASKAGSDHLVRAYFHTYHLPVTVSNCSNNYGPYQHSEKLIPTIIRACLEQKIIPIYGDGSNIRDWLYVEDHCLGILAILHNGKVGETYNIGGQNEISNLHVARHICDLMDQRFKDRASHQQLIQFVKDRPGHDWRYAIDDSKMRCGLQWAPEETFMSGLQKTIDYYCNEFKQATVNA